MDSQSLPDIMVTKAVVAHQRRLGFLRVMQVLPNIERCRHKTYTDRKGGSVVQKSRWSYVTFLIRAVVLVDGDSRSEVFDCSVSVLGVGPHAFGIACGSTVIKNFCRMLKSRQALTQAPGELAPQASIIRLPQQG